jgi:hypothetical protein
MEKIIVEWYSHEKNETGKTEIIAFSLQEAISIVRQTNDFKVICLGAEYKDKEALIRLVNQLNGGKVVSTLEVNVINIVNNYEAIKNQVEKIDRDYKYQLLNSLKILDFKNLDINQQNNLESFVRTFDEDIMVEYLFSIIERFDTEEFLKRFHSTFKKLIK